MGSVLEGLMGVDGGRAACPSTAQLEQEPQTPTKLIWGVRSPDVATCSWHW